MLHKRGAGCRCRSSNIVLSLFACGLLAVIGTAVDGAWRTATLHDTAQAPGLVKTLGLSDLALFTEARYLRHLSQADLHSAFQDHPQSLDHFPGGSVVGPPRHLRGEGGAP